MVRSFIVRRIYAEDDPKFLSDELEVQLCEGDRVIMSGDWYHNKINDKMQGFFACLDYLGIPYETREVRVNEEPLD